MTGFDAALETLARVLGPGVQLRAVAQTGSTNTDLLEACRTQVKPQLLVAEQQRAGRGRMGRTWHAEPGAALTFSLAWPCSGWSLDGLSLAVGSALAEALDPNGSNLRLKWPNDLWLHQRKLGGVLIETVSQGGELRAVVVGVGLNLQALPVDRVDVSTAGLTELDARWTPALALTAVAPALVALLQHWRGFDAAAQAAFAARDALRDQAVQADGFAGRSEGVDAHGLLLLREPTGQLRRLRAGEVRLRLEEAS
jgi:BirA family transcriptional regulator, biotin operon repressor / biotin---[acetyl-CoA-carboxylase] ligase